MRDGIAKISCRVVHVLVNTLVVEKRKRTSPVPISERHTGIGDTGQPCVSHANNSIYTSPLAILVYETMSAIAISVTAHDHSVVVDRYRISVNRSRIIQRY